MPLLFALTLFVSALLLFCVQPMIAKMILPLLGGSPSVWNTCMVFFQGALLVGYGYAHVATTRLGVRRQAAWHAGLLLLPLLVLPIGIAQGAAQSLPGGANPAVWLLGLLLVSVGLPFFVVATTSPLLQRWFAATGHPSGKDPYFLYAASNLGSMLALVGYPLLMEPTLRLAQQSRLWAAGYGVLIGLTLGCAIALWRSRGREGPGPEIGGERPAPPTPRRRLRWVALAFVPSSLMLGVTTYISTDIAAIPLLWVVPLALYLLSFVLVFARRPPVPHALMVRALPMLVIPLAITLFFDISRPALIPLHVLVFFVATMVCHGELARDRPPPEYLTEYYLWMSLGGVLGGLLNALVAPVVFDRVAEYPLAIVLACLARPAIAEKPSSRRLDAALGLAAGGAAAAIVLAAQARGYDAGKPPFVILFGPLMLICFAFADRPLRFALAIGAVLLAGALYNGRGERVLHRERNFFGVLRVVHDPVEDRHTLVYGRTLHGLQSLDPSRRHEPLAYYARTGPIGQVFDVFRDRPARPSVGAVGLGAGAIACYAEPGQRWTFYELDPAVERVARDPRYFTFLGDCRADALDVVTGDARLRLREAPEGGFGLIVLDAFSSDAIPVHLVTREALSLYLSKLADGGLLAFHISNAYLDLRPVLAALARDAGLVCLVRDDRALTADDVAFGKLPSMWAVMARRPADLGPLAADPRWRPAEPRPGMATWTDDYSDILGVLGR